LLNKPTDWKLLQDASFCKRVVHIGNYTDLVAEMCPDTIERMAALIAVIRPGKAHLQDNRGALCLLVCGTVITAVDLYLKNLTALLTQNWLHSTLIY
jgi:EamA domain-containing membrane protein RarD